MKFSLNKNYRPYSGTFNPKVPHYHADGSGRDLMVIGDSGGMTNSTFKTTNANWNFERNLRTFSRP